MGQEARWEGKHAYQWGEQKPHEWEDKQAVLWKSSIGLPIGQSRRRISELIEGGEEKPWKGASWWLQQKLKVKPMGEKRAIQIGDDAR